ncbi:hypothetical protein [Paenibacillus chitinolyticus]
MSRPYTIGGMMMVDHRHVTPSTARRELRAVRKNGKTGEKSPVFLCGQRRSADKTTIAKVPGEGAFCTVRDIREKDCNFIIFYRFIIFHIVFIPCLSRTSIIFWGGGEKNPQIYENALFTKSLRAFYTEDVLRAPEAEHRKTSSANPSLRSRRHKYDP